MHMDITEPGVLRIALEVLGKAMRAERVVGPTFAPALAADHRRRPVVRQPDRRLGRQRRKLAAARGEVRLDRRACNRRLDSLRAGLLPFICVMRQSASRLKARSGKKSSALARSPNVGISALDMAFDLQNVRVMHASDGYTSQRVV
jgi:hypothetical protein